MKPINLVRVRILIYTFWSLFVAWQTTMSDVIWSNMNWEQQSCLIAGIGALWLNTMFAFFDKSMQRYEESKNGSGIDKTNGAGNTPKP